MKPGIDRVLIILGLLVAWKLVRTDWLVSTPYEYMGNRSSYDVTAPVSPIWSPPVASDVESPPAGGAWGPTGPSIVRPNYPLSAIKVLAGLIILYPLLSILGRAFLKD